MTGTYSPSTDGYFMTIFGDTSAHYTLNLSQEGEFLMGTRGETENGHARQASFVAVRSNAQKVFTDSDAAGNWRFRSFELYDIESNFDREAAVCYGEVASGSGQGNIQVTCIEGGVHIRASYIFSKNDVIADIGIILSGALVMYLESRLPDLIIGALVSIIVVRGGLQIMREAREAREDDRSS